TVINNEDIHGGDFIMLVTDGVLEHLQDRNIETMFQAPGIDPQKVTTELNNLSQSFTKDNYSAYIIQVDKVEGMQQAAAPIAAAIPKGKVAPKENVVAASPKVEPQETEDDAFTREAERSDQLARIITFGIIGAIVLGLVGWLVYSSLTTDYDDYLADGNAAVVSGDLQAAKDAYQQALNNTDDPEKQAEIDALITDVGRRMADQALMANVSADSMESILLEANEMVDNGNYERAIAKFNMLVKAAEMKDDTMLNQYKVKLGEAYYLFANKLFGEKDYEEVIRVYEIGKATFGSDLSPESDDLIAQAQQNYQIALQETGNKPLVDQQIAQNNAGQTRRVAPRNDATNTNPANRTATTTRSAGTMDPTEEAELRKLLASGKRSYTSAKTNNSVSQYRQAAEDLENAEVVLDGPGAYLLAYMYSQGLGVQKDKSKALKFAQKSARKGWPSGQYYYGYLLLEREYPRDTITAIQSIRLAADQNFKLAVDKLIELGIPVQ
ncbi:MAG: hypothetical protein AAFR59_13150, partial [Bacteroidota bacterium]